MLRAKDSGLFPVVSRDNDFQRFPASKTSSELHQAAGVARQRAAAAARGEEIEEEGAPEAVAPGGAPAGDAV